jgi:magnesium transporter
MRSNLHAPAPSSTILRILKTQSEALCFFTPNPRGFSFDHAASRGPQLSSRYAPRQLITAVRPLSTAVSRHAIAEAGFLNLDFLMPRIITSAQQRSPVHPQQRAKHGGLRIDTQFRSQRNISTEGGRWLRKLWPQRKVTPQPLEPDDLPPKPLPEDGVDPSMFNLSRLSAKAANDPKLRCTEFDENGNVSLTNGLLKKSELIAKV